MAMLLVYSCHIASCISKGPNTLTVLLEYIIPIYLNHCIWQYKVNIMEEFPILGLRLPYT